MATQWHSINRLWVPMAAAIFSPSLVCSAAEPVAADAPKATTSLTTLPALMPLTPNFYPAENSWLVQGGVSLGNASIQSVTQVLGRTVSSLNLSEHSTALASSLRYGLSGHSELMVSGAYLAGSTLYPTGWMNPQLAYAYRITPDNSPLKSNLSAMYTPRSIFPGPWSGPAKYTLAGVTNYEVAANKWVTLGVQYRFKSSEKFPSILLLTSSVTQAFSSVVVSAGVSAKKLDNARPNLGSRTDNAWTPGVNLAIGKAIDARRGITLTVAHDRQKINEVLDSGYGAVNTKVRSSSAALAYYQAF
jgi:hypothetical protein